MELIKHFFICLILTILLYPLYGIQSFLVFIGGFFIDLDHYLLYVVKHKDFSIKKTFEYNLDENIKNKMHFFHFIEFLAIAVTLSIYIDFPIPITVGLTVHHIMDLYQILIEQKDPHARMHSFVEFLN